MRSKRFDDRIYQSVPSWTVEQGAISLTSANFQSLSATSGFINFQIQAPSQSVYLDRKVDWAMTVNASMTVDLTAVWNLGVLSGPVVTPGRDFSLCSYPLHALTTSMSASICDQQVSTNLSQNREIMDRLTDSPADREWSTSPAALDIWADNNDAYGSLQNPIGGFDSATTFSTIGNGAWPIVFCDANGVPVTTATTYNSGGCAISFSAALLPLFTRLGGALGGPVQVYFQFRSVEALQCSPFIYKEVYQRRTGLSQLQNMNVSMTISTARQAKLLRCTTGGSRSIIDYQLANVNSSGSPFSSASLLCQFLSPPMTPELPYSPVNTVDFQSITPYVYPTAAPTTPTLSYSSVTTQTLSLNTIPDWLIVAVQPAPSYTSSLAAINQGTWYMPISSANITWSNVTGLLSNLTQQQLYQISKCNGLKMPWAQWRGYSQTSTTSPAAPASGGLAWLTGGPLLLRPGVDITLPPGQASGQSNGQWTFSVQLTVDLSAIPASVLAAMGGTMQTTVLAINSGFFTTSSGTSRIITGPIPGGSDGQALAGIPSAGPLYRPAVLALTDLGGDSRVVGGRAPRRMRMSDRLM